MSRSLQNARVTQEGNRCIKGLRRSGPSWEQHAWNWSGCADDKAFSCSATNSRISMVAMGSCRASISSSKWSSSSKFDATRSSSPAHMHQHSGLQANSPDPRGICGSKPSSLKKKVCCLLQRAMLVLHPGTQHLPLWASAWLSVGKGTCYNKRTCTALQGRHNASNRQH